MKSTFLCLLILFLSTAVFSQRAERTDNSFAIKFSPFQMVLGELNFAYEQRVAKHASIEIDLGPTFSQLGIGDVNSHGPVPMPEPNPVSYSYERSAMGYFGSLGFRYYPLQYAGAVRGMYFSPIVKYRVFNTRYEDQMGILDDKIGAKTQIMFRFVTGFQFWMTQNFGMDVFMGVGLGNVSESSYFATNEYDPNTGTYTNKWIENKGSGARINATFGFKLSFGN